MQDQRATFAGVNAHHQNGMAERKIRTLQEHARTMLIHTNQRWPRCVTANLWPYALRMANDVLNETPNMLDKQKRLSQQIFSKTMVQTNIKHWKLFGCPVFVLDSRLQGSGGIFHKWKHRSKVATLLACCGDLPRYMPTFDLCFHLWNIPPDPCNLLSRA